jgi:hypothetical protein
MNKELGRDFDWVTARASCSPSKVFEILYLQVGRDVSIRSSLEKGNPKQYEVSVVRDGKQFSVVAEGHGVYRVAKFSLTDGGIEVHDATDSRKICAGLTLGDDGECRLRVGGKEYDLWQFRRLVLEDVLFIPLLG